VVAVATLTRFASTTIGRSYYAGSGISTSNDASVNVLPLVTA